MAINISDLFEEKIERQRKVDLTGEELEDKMSIWLHYRGALGIIRLGFAMLFSLDSGGFQRIGKKIYKEIFKK